MTRDVMDAGAAGVTYGRFVFQYPHVTPLVKTLGQVVHNGLSVKEAWSCWTRWSMRMHKGGPLC